MSITKRLAVDLGVSIGGDDDALAGSEIAVPAAFGYADAQWFVPVLASTCANSTIYKCLHVCP